MHIILTYFNWSFIWCFFYSVDQSEVKNEGGKVSVCHVSVLCCFALMTGKWKSLKVFSLLVLWCYHIKLIKSVPSVPDVYRLLPQTKSWTILSQWILWICGHNVCLDIWMLKPSHESHKTLSQMQLKVLSLGKLKEILKLQSCSLVCLLTRFGCDWDLLVVENLSKEQKSV